MSEQDTDETDDELGRRRYLAAVGAAGAFALAGCGGGGDGGDGGDSDGGDSDGGDGGDGGANDGGDGGDGGSPTTEADPTETLTTEGGEEQVCPSPPFAFVEYGATYPMTDDADPLVTFEAPEGEGFTVGTANRQWSLEYGPSRNRLDVRPERMSGTVEEGADPGAGSNADLTDQYDVPEGARVITPPDPGDVPFGMRVLLPTPTEGEHVQVRIGLTNTDACPEVAETVQDRIVNTVALA